MNRIVDVNDLLGWPDVKKISMHFSEGNFIVGIVSDADRFLIDGILLYREIQNTLSRIIAWSYFLSPHQCFRDYGVRCVLRKLDSHSASTRF